MVRGELIRADARHVLIDQNNILATRVEFEAGSTIRGELQSRGDRIRLEDVQALYLRPNDIRRLAPILNLAPTEQPKLLQALEAEDMLTSWADLMGGIVVNRPSAMATNGSKPYQCALIERCGLAVPRTLVTTDPDEVDRFRRECGTLVYKSISGVRSIVSRLTPEHFSRLGDIANCPTQFQEFVEGTDFRVHVVDKQVLTCRIVSTADDYRYASRAGIDVLIEEADLPDDVAQACITVTQELGLRVSGVDLRLRPDGRWCCFEVNPSPAFGYFQRACGLDISGAIARLLLSA